MIRDDSRTFRNVQERLSENENISVKIIHSKRRMDWVYYYIALLKIYIKTEINNIGFIPMLGATLK